MLGNALKALHYWTTSPGTCETKLTFSNLSRPHIDRESSVPIPKLPLILSSLGFHLLLLFLGRVSSSSWPWIPYKTLNWSSQVYLLDAGIAGMAHSTWPRKYWEIEPRALLHSRQPFYQLNSFPSPGFLQTRRTNADMPHCCKAAENQRENREVKNTHLLPHPPTYSLLPLFIPPSPSPLSDRDLLCR